MPSQRGFFQICFTVASLLLIVGLASFFARSENFRAAHAAGGFFDAVSGVSAHALRYDPATLMKKLHSDPDFLRHLSSQDILMIFHDPELIREEGSVTVFQYRNNECILDLYFKSEPVDVYKASIIHYEVRPRAQGVEQPQLGSCVKELMRQVHKPRMVDVSAIFKSPQKSVP